MTGNPNSANSFIPREGLASHGKAEVTAPLSSRLGARPAVL